MNPPAVLWAAAAGGDAAEWGRGTEVVAYRRSGAAVRDDGRRLCAPAAESMTAEL
ncbi:hypothetical protein AB0H42_11035 [Nocardia sp. NPDC050799]|uniref:hypothetical protein n=1 Tax=Nocardia sp. NPDC050799 TaxID=3154842 RepID=UPI0033FFDB4C